MKQLILVLMLLVAGIKLTGCSSAIFTEGVRPSGQGVSNSEFRIQNSELQSGDSTNLKMYVADREYFMKMQETVSSKNQYIGLQWCIDLLNKYIAIEEKRLSTINK